MASNPYKKVGGAAKTAAHLARLATWPVQGPDFFNEHIGPKIHTTRLLTPEEYDRKHNAPKRKGVGRPKRDNPAAQAAKGRRTGRNPAALAAQAQRKNMNAADVSMNNPPDYR